MNIHDIPAFIRGIVQPHDGNVEVAQIVGDIAADQLKTERRAQVDAIEPPDRTGDRCSIHGISGGFRPDGIAALPGADRQDKPDGLLRSPFGRTKNKLMDPPIRMRIFQGGGIEETIPAFWTDTGQANPHGRGEARPAPDIGHVNPFRDIDPLPGLVRIDNPDMPDNAMTIHP